MNRKKLLAANWKMNKTPDETRAFFRDFLPLVAGHSRDEIVVCPPYTSASAAIEAAQGSSVAIGVQNIHWKARRLYRGDFRRDVAEPGRDPCDRWALGTAAVFWRDRRHSEPSPEDRARSQSHARLLCGRSSRRTGSRALR